MIKIGETWYEDDTTSKVPPCSVCAFKFNDEKCKEAPCKDFQYYKEVFELDGRFYVLEDCARGVCRGCSFFGGGPGKCAAIGHDHLLCGMEQIFTEVFPCGY